MSDFELVIETDTRGFQPVELRVESLLYDRVELSDELKACFYTEVWVRHSPSACVSNLFFQKGCCDIKNSDSSHFWLMVRKPQLCM